MEQSWRVFIIGTQALVGSSLAYMIQQQTSLRCEFWDVSSLLLADLELQEEDICIIHSVEAEFDQACAWCAEIKQLFAYIRVLFLVEQQVAATEALKTLLIGCDGIIHMPGLSFDMLIEKIRLVHTRKPYGASITFKL